MPLTPAEVHNVAFKKPPIGKRGYDEEEVDAFLDVVEVELARLIEENNDLRANGSSGASADKSIPPSTIDRWLSWRRRATKTAACTPGSTNSSAR
jgi:DivIVA domain-containing protein